MHNYLNNGSFKISYFKDITHSYQCALKCKKYFRIGFASVCLSVSTQGKNTTSLQTHQVIQTRANELRCESTLSKLHPCSKFQADYCKHFKEIRNEISGLLHLSTDLNPTFNVWIRISKHPTKIT